VRIALTSGLTHKQVTDDLGVGMSTLNKSINGHRDTDVVSKEHLSLPKRMTGFGAKNGFSRRSGKYKGATEFFAGLKP
jgi:transposase